MNIIPSWTPAWRLLVIGAVVLGCAAAAAAQEREPEPVAAPTPHPFGQLRLGTLAFTPTFRISNIGWDTNVFDLSGEQRRPADFTATFDPGVETRITTDRLDVRALTHAMFVYYQTYKTEQAINPVVNLTVDDRLSSRLTLYAEGLYGYSKARTGLEVDSRPRIFSQATTLGARITRGKMHFDFHGRYSDVAYDENAKFLDVTLAQTLDQRTAGGGASVGYALSPYTTVLISGDQDFHHFPLAPDRDMNTLSSSVGVRFNPRAVISGEAAFGYQRADPRSARTPAFAGITPRAGLTYKLSDVLSLGVGGERGLEASFYGDRPYFIYTLYEASARLAIFHHFDVGGSLQRTTLDYRTFLDIPGPPVEPQDVVRMETVDVGVPINRQLRVGVFGQRWRRFSEDHPYQTTRIGLEMTLGPANISQRGIFLSGPSR